MPKTLRRKKELSSHGKKINLKGAAAAVLFAAALAYYLFFVYLPSSRDKAIPPGSAGSKSVRPISKSSFPREATLWRVFMPGNWSGGGRSPAFPAAC